MAYLSIYGKGRLKAMVDLDQSPKMIADKSWKYGFKDLTWDNYPDMLKFDFGKAFYHHIDEKKCFWLLKRNIKNSHMIQPKTITV